MKHGWLVGIDDTDNADSIGTGRLARMLAEHLESRGLLSGTSVTRHQLLVHPDIPYTSHNSSACIAGQASAASSACIAGQASAASSPSIAEQASAASSASIAEQASAATSGALVEAAHAFLREHFHEGANPGLCVAASDAAFGGLVDLAKRAQREVLRLEAFDAVAAAADVAIRSAGETGQGRIGAASGVALRSTGEDGRFIGLAGIRDLAGRLPVGEIVARSGVDAVALEDGEVLAPDVAIDTRDWVRPSLRGGRAVLRVRREGGGFVPAERRSKDD